MTSHFSVAKSTCAPPQRRHCIQASSTFRSNAPTILIFLLEIVWIVQFTRPNSRQMSAVYFSIFDFSYHLKFFFEAQNLPFVRHCSHANCSGHLYALSELPLRPSLFRDVTQRRLVSGQPVGPNS